MKDKIFNQQVNLTRKKSLYSLIKDETTGKIQLIVDVKKQIVKHPFLLFITIIEFAVICDDDTSHSNSFFPLVEINFGLNLPELFS